jgi:dipeptidyl aminopeptidase/acylaminoacyl peptidase
MRSPLPWVLALALILSLRGQPADSLITASDLLKINQPADPAVSPDARQVVYTVRTLETQPSGDTIYRNRIWLASLDGNHLPRPLLNDGPNAFVPVWHPSGDRIAFVRPDRGRSARIWVLPLAEGAQPFPITPPLADAANPRWSPDGGRLLFTATVGFGTVRNALTKVGSPANPPWPADGITPPAAIDPTPAKPKPDVKPNVPASPSPEGHLSARLDWLSDNEKHREPFVTTRLDVAAAFESGPEPEFTHVFVVSGTDTAPVDVTPGFASYVHPGWLADSRTFVCAGPASPDEHPDRVFKRRLFTGTVDGPVPAPFLTSDTYSLDFPVVSPAGSEVAFLAQPCADPADLSYGQTRLGISTITAPKLRLLTAKFDRSVEPPQWSADGKHLYFTAETSGGRPLHRIAAGGGNVDRITSLDTWTVFFSAGKDDLALVLAKANNPGELYRTRLNGRDSRILTAHNSGWLRDKKPASPERRKLKLPSGREIDYWVTRPPYLEGAFQYPLLLLVHGGPGAMWGPGDPAIWHDVQFFAARGYGVVFANPLGSSGYGYDFQHGSFQNWGPGPGSDLLAVVDAVTDREKWIDSERPVILGGSYGGYLTTWIISHDQRFKAAIAERGVYDLTTFLGEGTAWPLVPWHFGGYPWQPEIRKLLDEQSPLTHIANIRTPLLIQQNEADSRVGTAQGELLYRGLKLLDRPVEYVRYPRATHDLSRSGEPAQRIDRLVRYDAFFQRFIGAPAQLIPPPAPPAPKPQPTPVPAPKSISAPSQMMNTDKQ